VPVVLAVALAVSSVLAQTTPPPLPRLAVDSYPPAAREALARVATQARANPTSVEAVGIYARTLHAWELWDAAHQAYERVQQLDVKAFEWRYLDALVLQRLARDAEAAARLREALALSPDYLPARVKFAEALLEAGKLEESKTLFTALTREPAAEPIAALGLGRIAAAERDHEAAIVHLNRAVALFPEFGAAHYALARSYRALARTGEAQAAVALHEKYGPRWPAVEDPVLHQVSSRRVDPRAEVQRGMKLADAGDLEGAIRAHEAALARDPSLAQAHGNLISLYGRSQNWSRAEAHYRALLDLGVNLGEAHYDYGVLLGLQDKWDLAEEAYGRALAVNPHHADAHNNLGQILERQRRLDAAARSYRQAVESQPGFRLARFNLGRMLIALDRPEEAVSELARLAEPRDAETARYIFALSVAHVRAGRRAEGIKWATEARAVALQFGQHDLAAAIARDLALLK
jgi:tetratricopeptide (TPR) repeat protein